MMTRFILGGIIVAWYANFALAQAPAPNPLLPPLPMNSPSALPGVPPPTGGERLPAEPEPAPAPLPPLPPLPGPLFDAAPAMGCSTCGGGGCPDPGCGGGVPADRPPHPVWGGYTQLLLWFQPARVPFPLATAARPGEAAQNILSDRSELGLVNAFQFAGGLWLNADHTFGLGLGGFISEQRTAFRSVSGGPGTVTLRRPFLDAVTATPDALLVANADPATTGLPPLTGSIVTATSARLAGADINLTRNLCHWDGFHADFFYGFQYYDLDESLTVYSATTTSPGSGATLRLQPVPDGATIAIRDRVYTRNQFYGGMIGGKFEQANGLFTLGVTPRVGFGNMHQITQIYGQTRVSGDALPPSDGGLLAVGEAGFGNMGRFVTNRFTITTQVGTYVGVRLTPHMRATLGYQLIYLADVARPGDQLDPVINPRAIPVSPSFGAVTGPVAPRIPFERTDFIAHGATIGFEWAY